MKVPEGDRLMGTTNDYASILAESGIDYAEAMDRFGGNEALYRRLAVKFLDDQHVEALEKALEANDAEQAFRETSRLPIFIASLALSVRSCARGTLQLLRKSWNP